MIEPNEKENKEGKKFIEKWGKLHVENGRALRPWADVAHAYGLARRRKERDVLAKMLRECKGNYRMHLGVTRCLNCGEDDEGEVRETFPHRDHCLTVRADALLKEIYG